MKKEYNEDGNYYEDVKEEETEWYEDEMNDNTMIQKAMSSAKAEFHRKLAEQGWEDFQPAICIEVREVRHGDNTLGKLYVLDEIEEHVEDKFIKKEEE